MNPIAITFALCTLAVCGGAQSTFVLPTNVATTSNNIPMGVGQVRFQQWFSAAEWSASLTGPAQVTALDLLPGQLGTTTTVELQVTMGHGAQVGLNGFFQANIVSDRTVVFGRNTVTMTAGQALALNFNTNFGWNGVDPVVLEIQVFNNGQGGGTISHENQYTTSGSGKTSRAYTLGDPNATFATQVQAGWGLMVRFTTAPGSQLDYGTGCPGAAGAVPQATVTSGIPSPGSIWVHQVLQVNSSRLCVWTIGPDNTMWNGTALPADLSSLGAPGCFLLNNLEHTEIAISVGGGPGAGIAQVVINIPPITPVVGQSWYTQWFVLDEQSANGLLAASQGIWTVIAP